MGLLNGAHYINLIKVNSDKNCQVILFTEQGKYVNQDCYHFIRTSIEICVNNFSIIKTPNIL